LADIVEAAQAIRLFLTKLDRPDREDFVKNDLVRSAVLQKLTVVGEAAARVSEQTTTGHPEIPWRQARGMRNLPVHAYFSVDWDIVWTTATESVPRLETQIARILESPDVDQ